MKDTIRRWGRALLDPFAVQLYFIVCTFFVEIPVIMAYFQWWKKIGLIWAIVVILYDLFTRRRFLKTRFALPVLGLLAAYAVTLVGVWANYSYAFQESYLDWGCSVVALLVLYPPTTDDRETGLRRMDVLNWLLVVLTTVVSAIGVWMFIVGYGTRFYSDITDYNYCVGFVSQRLTGLYRNAIYPTPLIAIFVAFLQLARTKGRARLRRGLLIVGVVVNTLHLVLSNSRGVVYALALFAALAAMFLVRRRLNGRRWMIRWGIGALAAATALSAVLVAVPLVRDVFAYVPPLVERVSQTIDKPSDGDAADWPIEGSIDPLDLDRVTPDYYGAMTGRPIIWRQGMGFFAERPWFGYGPYALKDEVSISEEHPEPLAHFHNIFVQSLVSLGVVGSLFFIVLLLGAAWLVLCRMIFDESHEHYTTLVLLGAMLAALLCVNLADVTIFFLSKNSEFVFWSYLGYTLLLVDDKPLKLDAPVRFVDERLPRLRPL